MSNGPYEDDPVGVPAGSQLIRRINQSFCDWRALDKHGRPRITRQAVQFYRAEEAHRLGCPGPAMSFYLEDSLDSVDALRGRHPDYGFARVGVDVVRAEGAIGVQPWPTDDEPAHVVAFRTDGGSKLQQSAAKRIAEHLTRNWVSLPPRPGSGTGGMM